MKANSSGSYSTSFVLINVPYVFGFPNTPSYVFKSAGAYRDFFGWENGTFFCVGDPKRPRYLAEASNCKSYLDASDLSYSNGDNWDTVSRPVLQKHVPGETFEKILQWLDKKRETAASSKRIVDWTDTRIGRLSDLPLNRAYDITRARLQAMRWHVLVVSTFFLLIFTSVPLFSI